jgi:hypothetical protein
VTRNAPTVIALTTSPRTPDSEPFASPTIAVATSFSVRLEPGEDFADALRVRA